MRTQYAVAPPITVATFCDGTSLASMETALRSTALYANAPRLVLHIHRSASPYESLDPHSEDARRLVQWADDSVGPAWDHSFEDERAAYVGMPPLRKYLGECGTLDAFQHAQRLLGSVRSCKHVFHTIKGNRSCFDKCD